MGTNSVWRSGELRDYYCIYNDMMLRYVSFGGNVMMGCGHDSMLKPCPSLSIKVNKHLIITCFIIVIFLFFFNRLGYSGTPTA